MSTSMNNDRPQTKPTVGLLLIIGEIISNEQRDDICLCLENTLQQVDSEKYHEIHDLFNHLIHENEFQIDSQYRQIATTEGGSTAGFLYLPNFHTLANVLKDLFNTCYHVCVIFCGQQVDSNGALILSDSTFTSENFRSLFEENPTFVLQDLQIILPLVAHQWSKLVNNYLQKQLEYVELNDLSHSTSQENVFGERFYERLIQSLRNDAVNFDIYSKLTPRDSSGTIAFDEPNLYIFYGQQGEASLFGVRGFVVLINGGFSRTPSYWNIIRGLQTIDACVLTHFDYDVFPGLQTVVHRKRTFSPQDEQSSKPDIGAIFLNHMQRAKLQSTSTSKSQSNNRLSMNLTENIDQFLQNVKELNIDTFNLIKHTTSNKQTVEPINLYKKIAFGSLDLFVLHPTSLPADDDKLITALQKIPIDDQPVSSSTIPAHHWYSSCLLLVWTPSAKSNKDGPVRVLYTGACPQTLVFEALNKARHLEFLHESQTHLKTTRASNEKTSSSTRATPGAKPPAQKPKIPTPVNHRSGSAIVQNRAAKPSPRPTPSKPKAPPAAPTSSKTPRTTSTVKKVPPSTVNRPTRSVSKEKKPSKPHESKPKATTAAKPAKTHVAKVKSQTDPKPKSKVQAKPKKQSTVETDQKQTSETTNGHAEELGSQNDHEAKVEAPIDEKEHADVPQYEEEHPEIPQDGEEHLEVPQDEEEYPELPQDEKEQLEVPQDEEQQLDTHNGHEDLPVENEDEPVLESQNNEYEQSDENDASLANDLDEQQFSTNELNESNDVSADNREEDVQRPESISLTTEQQETFVKSNSGSPDNELTSQLSPRDPMAASFTDGASDTEDPFTEITDDQVAADEMEIIHHSTSGSPKHPIPSVDDIEPQGLPIEKNASSKQSSSAKLSNGTGTRSANGSARQSKQVSTFSSLSSISHVDVAYIPHHGDEHYVDSEFFRRIHARYYILNAVQTSPQTLDSFVNGIAQWNGKGQQSITLVPTFDSEELRHFFVRNKNRLAELNIEILPASSRCNVQYDDESSPAQLLRFGSNTDAQQQ